MNKKKLIILISIIIALAILACVGIFALSGRKPAGVAEQLDLGEKYLEELEYEKALAVYKEILEIDPKSVDAYLGMAEVYIAMGEYEEALKVLEEGYEETESRKLERKIEEVKALMIGGESSANNAETGTTSGSQGDDVGSGGDGLDPRFKACVVDGVYHNGYSLYDLTEDENNLLASLIQYAEEENWDELFTIFNGEPLVELADSYVEMEEHNGGKKGEIRIAFAEYKVYLQFNATYRYLVIIPLDDGKGYYIEGRTSTFNSEPSECRRVMIADCRNGMFNGAFQSKENQYDMATRELLLVKEVTGSMVNGLLDGTIYYYMDGFTGWPSYSIAQFEAGIPEIVKEEAADGMTILHWGCVTDENWEVLSDDWGSVYPANIWYKVDNEEGGYVAPDHYRTGWETDGGMRYYPW